MPPFSSAHDQTVAREEARVAETLRNFWKSGSESRSDSIWSNIESAIQPADSRWSLPSLESFKHSVMPTRVQFATTIAAIVLTVLAGTLLFARISESAQVSPGRTDSSQALAVNNPVADQSDIPGYTDAIVHYQENLTPNILIGSGGDPGAGEVMAREQPLTPPTISTISAADVYQPGSQFEVEQSLASTTYLGRDPGESTVLVIEDTASALEPQRINSEIAGGYDTVVGNGMVSSVPTSGQNGVGRISNDSGTPNVGSPESTAGAGVPNNAGNAPPPSHIDAAETGDAAQDHAESDAIDEAYEDDEIESRNNSGDIAVVDEADEIENHDESDDVDDVVEGDSATDHDETDAIDYVAGSAAENHDEYKDIEEVGEDDGVEGQDESDDVDDVGERVAAENHAESDDVDDVNEEDAEEDHDKSDDVDDVNEEDADEDHDGSEEIDDTHGPLRASDATGRGISSQRVDDKGNAHQQLLRSDHRPPHGADEENEDAAEDQDESDDDDIDEDDEDDHGKGDQFDEIDEGENLGQ